MGIYISTKEYNYKESNFFFNASLVLFDLGFNLAEIQEILINVDTYINVCIVSIGQATTLLLRIIWIWIPHDTNY